MEAILGGLLAAVAFFLFQTALSWVGRKLVNAKSYRAYLAGHRILRLLGEV